MILTGYLNLIKNIYLGLMDASDLKIRRDTEFRFITWTRPEFHVSFLYDLFQIDIENLNWVE